MLIYILHSDKIYTFRLPKEISGNYVLTDIDDEGHIRNLTNIKAIDNKWFIISNENAFISYGNQEVEQVELLKYNFYSIRLFKKETILLYTFPFERDDCVVKNVLLDSNLKIGSDNKCDIILLNTNVSDNQVELSNFNGIWKLKNVNPRIPIYVNHKSVIETNLDNFDMVFIMGMRLMVIKNKLFIISSPTLYKINSSNIVTEEKLYNSPDVKAEENIKNFYDESSYFTKSPVFIKKYSEYKETITSPIAKEKNSGSGFMSQIIPSALMSVTSLLSVSSSIKGYKNGSIDKDSLFSSMIMCLIMLITGIVWPIVEMIASKVRQTITNKMRVINYKHYLKRKRKKLIGVLADEKSSLEFNNLSLEACQDSILRRNSYLFSRNIGSKLFLNIKIGVGKIPSSINFLYERPDLIVDNDKLLNDIDKLIADFKYIEDAPFSLSLKDYNSIAFINSNGLYDLYLKSIILQLITFHDYESLKLVILTSEFSNLCKIKNINHCWNNDKTFRFFASNLNDAENVSSELMKIFNDYNSNEKTNKSNRTYYLIITDFIAKYKNLKIIDSVIHSNGDSDFGIIMFSSRIVDIPIGCKTFVDYNNEKASFFQAEMDENSIVNFKPELIGDNINFDSCINAMADIPIKVNEGGSKGNLPDKLGFLEMYNVGNLEQLNILNRWRSSSIISTLATPIGVDPNGNTIFLDLHEKKHGPHGLIAGMTGSGKSEFIVTYILSLAINYSPDEVQFVLIDYKGGGLAGAFENRKTGIKLPHLVGTITNLDKAEMNRTLVSIKSELQRRQKVFNRAKEKLDIGSIDIYKYQSLVRDGSLSESMAHLFIICDEFAELKAQQPEFMDELVSAARIGRSLGIHLILATQKPSGVVDDQIWSNAKFKVCCRVQTTEDSNEMLRKPDAAYLKESGRFYLQVGYDEYFVLGQSGYSGVQYVPSDTVVSKLDDSVSFVNDIGDIYKTAKTKDLFKDDSVNVNYGEELNNILKYIVGVANKNGYTYHQLWLDNVPKLLLYDYLVKKYSNITVKPFDINPIIGEFDDPKNQSQGCVYLPLSNGSNTVLIGSTGMGKTTFLSTVIYSTIINHSNSEVNFYIIDLSTEKLKKFSKAPHVGDVLCINDKQKITYLFYMIESEISKRQSYYSTNGGEFSLDVRNGKSIFPNIIVIIHGMENFKENFDVLYNEKFASITRMSAKYGITFLVTGNSIDIINYAVESNFSQKIFLNVNDPNDYKTYFNEFVIPSKNPGRGVISMNSSCVEFQTAIDFPEENEKKCIDYILAKLNQIFPNKAAEVPHVPKHLSFKYLADKVSTLSHIPIGISVVTAQDVYLDMSLRLNLLSAYRDDKIKRFMVNFVKLLSLCENNKVIVLNAIGDIKFCESDNVKCYNSNFKNVIPTIASNINKINSTNTQITYCIVILGYSRLNSHLIELKNNDNNVITIDELVLKSNNANFKFMIYDVYSSFNSILEGNLSNVVDNQNGLWVGSDFDMQDCFECSKLYGSNISSDNIVVIKDSETEVVKVSTID